MQIFAKVLARIEKYKGISDKLELEIANYVENVVEAHVNHKLTP